MSGALLVAFQATDALLGSIVVNTEILLARLGFHWAVLVARSAIYAVRRAFREYRGESVENGKTSTQWAEHFAEETLMPHNEDYY